MTARLTPTEARQLDMFKSRRQRGTKAPSALEFATHCAIADTLDRWLEPGWMWWHCPNGGRREKRKNPKTGETYSPEGGRLKRQGVKPGVSDFLLVSPPRARLHALELKRQGEVPTRAQLDYGARLERAGGVFAWTDTYAGAIAILKTWDALPSRVKPQ
jgi:hypothetical protein